MIIEKLTGELTAVISQNAPSLSKTAPSGFDIASPVKNPAAGITGGIVTPVQLAGGAVPGSDIKDNNKGEAELKVSVMDDLFCGELNTMITCPNCSNITTKKETFYYLSVPLPQEVIVNSFSSS